MAKWTSNDNSDKLQKARTEMAIRGLYRGAGLPAPEHIIWFASPLAMAEEAPKGTSLKPSLSLAWLGASTGTVQHPLVSLFRSISDEGAAAPVLRELRRRGAKQVEDICVFRNDARLIDFYNLFLSEQATARDQSPLRFGQAPFTHLDFIIPHDNVCYVSQSPRFAHVDGTGRLHNTEGAAATYADGWKVYAVEGFWMPGYMMEHASALARLRGPGE